MFAHKSKVPATQAVPEPLPDDGAGTRGLANEPHPAGKVKHGAFVQVMRLLLASAWSFSCISITCLTQFVGAPLYFVNMNCYYTYMALTKQSFGLLIITLTQWFSPTVIRISGDRSVRGQLLRTKDGRLQTAFPERLIMIANHQLYSDWLYLWWVAYANNMHGHVYIILKESLKYIPVIGPGMMFYGFIFMARNWVKDKPRLRHRLQKLKTTHSGILSGSSLALDPMWLIIFPEGTNLSGNTRKGSAQWAAKRNLRDLSHLLLPRSTGLEYCLQELHGTVDWLYDCTVAYEGIPRGAYGQDIFTLRNTYVQGRPPKSVNMHWRRFSVSGIPLEDHDAFERWLSDRWHEKEALIEHYVRNGRFPADDGHDSDGEPAALDGEPSTMPGTGAGGVKQGCGFIETEVKLGHWYEILSIFAVLASFALFTFILAMAWNRVVHGSYFRRG